MSSHVQGQEVKVGDGGMCYTWKLVLFWMWCSHPTPLCVDKLTGREGQLRAVRLNSHCFGSVGAQGAAVQHGLRGKQVVSKPPLMAEGYCMLWLKMAMERRQEY